MWIGIKVRKWVLNGHFPPCTQFCWGMVYVMGERRMDDELQYVG